MVEKYLVFSTLVLLGDSLAAFRRKKEKLRGGWVRVPPPLCHSPTQPEKAGGLCEPRATR